MTDLRTKAEAALVYREDYLEAAYDHKGRPRPPVEETSWEYQHGDDMDGEFVASWPPSRALAALDCVAFVRTLAERECDAREFYDEAGKDEKCLDLNYNEESDPAKLERCDPCAARLALAGWDTLSEQSIEAKETL